MEFTDKVVAFCEFIASFTISSGCTTLIILFFPTDTVLYTSELISTYTRYLVTPLVPYINDFILFFTWENASETAEEEGFLSYYGPSLQYWITTAMAGYIASTFYTTIKVLYTTNINFLSQVLFMFLCPNDWGFIFNQGSHYLYLYNLNMYTSFVQLVMDPTPREVRALVLQIGAASDILHIDSNYQLNGTLDNMTTIFIFVFWTSFTLGLGYLFS